ncbi:hypothetical protein ZIOFF_055349 [Zingiber officinale]|uniref:Uncharacterized protein n=1 Tax=Zingiber officinale TaxID=94328 RepID=A0A8J5KPW6_ZINOF|nr:hypothetical protein ZIOFF_055349 [Zingiber officinale]
MCCKWTTAQSTERSSRRFYEVPSTKVGDDRSFMNSPPFLLSSRLIGLSLLFFGYLIAVTGVDNGKKELELLRMEPNVNMIITDYWMLEMIGYDLLKRIKMFGSRSRRFLAEACEAI